MKINEIIRSKRIEKGLTQEQVANILNISTPAVNKWESGISHPDITLLPALGRLLGVDMNTLLSFKDSLTEEEIIILGNEIMQVIDKEGFDKGYEMAMDKISEYPNSELLLFNLILMLKGALMSYPNENSKKYEVELDNLLYKLINSKDIQIREIVYAMLIPKYIDNDELEKAEELINKLHTENPSVNKTILQTELYVKQKNYNKALITLESKIYYTAMNLQLYISSLMKISALQNNMEDANYFAKLADKLMELLEMPNSCMKSGFLELAMEEKNIEKTLEYLNSLVTLGSEIIDFKNSRLYKNIPIKENYNSKEFRNIFLNAMLNELKTSKEYDFLRNSIEFDELINKYEEELEKLESSN
ncbi:helix-turn-helix domain-containing protein [Miniphocaeibacter halophilus]|uniref:Helix-turn-helix transcriptional regulator n=1 Tax=Miniphocaeibacter halophilus TaxID=2931922 RepID=A0AC61MSW1_9FIRM|nr:helix-turn-helix transcriptional regulator [Miniphocaeibacter halophilus]QQK08631.1 helix-turn-helix transcriptional regulator [Miniphocaeibacter halophilus]